MSELDDARAKLSGWKATETRLRKELRAAVAGICAQEAKIAEIRYGVKVGSIIRDRKGKEHRVIRVDGRWASGRPWLEGNPRKKDGSFGVAVRHIYGDWQLVEPADAS